MNLSLRRVGEQNLYYKESSIDSDLKLVFISGGFNSEIWKNQDRYFSKKYKTVFFEPTASKEGFEGEREGLENILNQRDMKNTVLVSGITGNSLAQHFEDHENVIATFMTGKPCRTKLPPRAFHKFFWSLTLSEPKMLRKSLFSDETPYKTLKQFSEDVEIPRYSILKQFANNYNIHKPSKPSTTVYGEDDRLSTLKDIRTIQEDRFISLIQRAGTFSFYEKPQEYNKALNDFLTKLEKGLENKEHLEARKNNRSLFEFERKKKNGRKKHEIKVVKK